VSVYIYIYIYVSNWLQCVTVSNALQCFSNVLQCVCDGMCRSVSAVFPECVAVCYFVLQCVSKVLQCV